MTLFIAPFAWFVLGCAVSFRFGAGVFGVMAAGLAVAEAVYIWSSHAWEHGHEADDAIGVSVAMAIAWFLIFLLGQAARLIFRRNRKVPER